MLRELDLGPSGGLRPLYGSEDDDDWDGCPPCPPRRPLKDWAKLIAAVGSTLVGVFRYAPPFVQYLRHWTAYGAAEAEGDDGEPDDAPEDVPPPPRRKGGKKGKS